MSAPIVQAQYDSLEEIAKRFDQQASDSEKMTRHLIQMLEQLEGGGWEGDSAQAFFREMNDEVIPTTNNLRDAFTESAQTTRKIVLVMQAAEDEAANQFDLSQSSSSQSGGVATQPSGTGVQPGSGGTPNAPNGGRSGQSGSILDNFEFQGKGNIWTYDKNDKGAFDPGLGVVYGTKDLAAFGDPSEDGFSAVGGKGGVGLGVGPNGEPIAGAFGEFYVGQGKIDGVYGDEDLAVTGGVTGKVLSADGFAGYRDGSVGAQVGFNLVSVEGEAGVNVLGANVGVKGEVGLKLELGFSIGKETEIKLPFVTLGFSFGGAKE